MGVTAESAVTPTVIVVLSLISSASCAYMYTVVDTMCVLNNAIVSKNSFYFVNNSQNNWKMNILKLLCFVGQEISLLLVLPCEAYRQRELDTLVVILSVCLSVITGIHFQVFKPL